MSQPSEPRYKDCEACRREAAEPDLFVMMDEGDLQVCRWCYDRLSGHHYPHLIVEECERCSNV